MRGSNHHRFDKTLYRFLSPKGELVISTRYNLRKTYNLNQSNLNSLIKGKIRSHRGWEYIGKLTNS